MYTMMFSVLLTSAGLASNGQSGAYGGMGGSFVYGDYGQYAGQCFLPYPYYPPISWGGTPVRVEDPKCAELEKKVHDLTTIMRELVNREKEMELRLEQQDKLAELQKDLFSKLTDAIAKINARSDVTPAAHDSEAKRMIDFETRMRAVEAGKQDTTNALLIAKILDVLDRQMSVKNDPGFVALQKQVGDITHQINGIALKLDDAPKIQSTEMKSGHPLTRALIIVSLPADAKLFVDSFPSTIGSNLRSFISPDLEPGKSFFYNLRLEVTRKDKTYVAEQKVYFQPGREVHVSFDSIETAIANNAKKE